MHMCCNRFRQSSVHRHCFKNAPPQASLAQAPQQAALPASPLAQGLHWQLPGITDVVVGYMHVAPVKAAGGLSGMYIINNM